MAAVAGTKLTDSGCQCGLVKLSFIAKGLSLLSPVGAWLKQSVLSCIMRA